MSTQALPTPCACCSEVRADGVVDLQRRRVIRIAAVGVALPLAVTSLPVAAVAGGLRLVDEDAEGPPAPLRPDDLKPGKPVLAYPFDPSTGKRLDETRLNKLVLVKLAEAEMAPETRALSAGGVLAYSAICTHQACDVKTWLAKEKALVCFCHSSKFALLDGAAVITGPASRPLPSAPLKLEGGVLVLAGGFSAKPGPSA
jgi:rieske iron-sulfur protein